MFKEMKLKAQIRKCHDQIDFLEKKRSRSQAALVSAILNHTEPADEDVDFFNTYTAQIEEVRELMRNLPNELNAK